MNLPSIVLNYVSARGMWNDVKKGISVTRKEPLSQEEIMEQLKKRLPQVLSDFSWGVIGFFGSDEITLRDELGPAIISLGTSNREVLLREACSYIKETLDYSKVQNVNILDILKNYPDVYNKFKIARALCGIHSKIFNDSPIPKEEVAELCKSILAEAREDIFYQILVRIKGYLESHGFEVPEELIKALESFPKPKEIDYWEEYQNTLKDFDEKGREFHEKAKREWELVKDGKSEDPIGSIQEVIWNLSEAVVYNFALRRFKLVKEAYKIFLEAYEFVRENSLFKTKLDEDIWLGKLKRVNLKWGNDIRWYEDYRIISNRIIRLTRIAEFMMWKRRIPEFLYANPYTNLGGDYEENDPPLWALTGGLIMILDHNRSRGVLPGLTLQEEVLNHALRLNLLWPEKTEALECKDGTCIIFRRELNEKAIKGLKRDAWDNDIVFYHGKDTVVGYSRKRKLGYICTKSKDEKEIMALVS